jgi:hypothetical protein
MPRLSKIETSSNAEQELSFLGRKPQLENSISTMNLNVLKDRYKCCDIFPMVKLELLRDQDKNQRDRVELAKTVAGSMADSLTETFAGDALRSKLVLRINMITVVSNGCCPSRDRIKGLFGRGKAQGKGLAKLTVSYCLYCRETGAVAVAKQISRSEERSRDEKCGKTVLMELEEALRNEISKEVKFTCCSRLPEWSQFSMRMLAVDPGANKLDEEESDEIEHTGSSNASKQ